MPGSVTPESVVRTAEEASRQTRLGCRCQLSLSVGDG